MLTDVASRAADASESQLAARKNIVFFDHTSKISGGEIALLNLVKTLDKSRYKPIVILCAEGPLVESLRNANIETHVLPLDVEVLETRKDSLGMSSILQLRKASSILNYIGKLSTFLRKLDADLVHANSLKSDIIGAFAAKLAGVPVIWHVRDRIADDYLPRKVVRLFRWMCAYVPDHVIAISEATRATLSNSQEPKDKIEQKLTIVHDGIAPEALRISERQWQRQDQVRIGLIGRLSPWKGQHIFLKAAAQVHQLFPDARFEIIGSSLFGEKEYEEELVKLTEELNLGKSVQFLGFRNNVLDVIEDLDIVVHASTTAEPFGQVVIEGMASQKPVVATKGGGVLEIIEDHQSGLLVPMNDAVAMAAAIIELLNNPEKARQIGLNAQKRVQEHFLIEQTARKVENVYERVFQRRG
jgi:glycosyltransferase involved in cell wall biosynthesis